MYQKIHYPSLVVGEIWRNATHLVLFKPLQNGPFVLLNL